MREKVLVRATNWVGDMVMCMPAIASIRKNYPDAHICALVRPPLHELLEGSPAVDEIIPYDRKNRYAGPAGVARVARELRKKKFDRAILLQNAFEAALVAFLAKIPRRMGYTTDGRGLLLTQGVKVSEETRGRHQVYYYLDLLTALGLKTGSPAPRLHVRKDELKKAEALLRENGVKRGSLVVGINPGAQYGVAKRWHPERFGAVADRLAREYGARIVIFGGPGEVSVAGAVEASMKAGAVNLAGRTGLRELMALIKTCRLFITNDTGPMHVSAALGTPTLAVFGSTDPVRTGPFGQGHRVVREPVNCGPCLRRECPQGHYLCMERVTAGRVFGAASEMIDAGRPLKKAVFLDRDGTINEDVGYLSDPGRLTLLPGTAEALSRLKKAGFTLVVVSNQSGIARGYMSEDDLAEVNGALKHQLSRHGVAIGAFYHCPHHPDFTGECDCRKPRTGMAGRAARELGIDLARSYFVGDKASDVMLGKNSGGRSVLVLTGFGRGEKNVLEAGGVRPDKVASGLPEAADWILKDSGASS